MNNELVEKKIMKLGLKCMEAVLESKKGDSSDGSHVYAAKCENSGMMKIFEEYGVGIIQKYFRNMK